MRRPGGVLLGLLLALGGPMGCAATAASLRSPLPVQWKADSPTVVPFRRDVQGRIILDGAVNGRPATVHLDSGAVSTLVLDKLMDRTTARRVDTTILNGQARVERWRGVRIDVGPLSIQPNVVLVADRTDRADVVIGNPVFEQAVVGIDYEAATVTFQSPEQFIPPAGATALPLTQDSRRVVTAKVSLNGAPPICVGVDLGFNGSLSLAPSVVESHALLTDPAVQATHQTVGREPIRVPGLQRIERVTIAGFDVSNVFASPGGHDDSPCGSLLGTELLSGFRLDFDLPRNTLWLTPRADLAPRFETTMKFTYRNTPTGMLITAIATNSPVRGVLEIGDRVVRIEREPVVFTMANGEQRRPPQSASPAAPPEGEQPGGAADLPPLGGVRP